MASSIAITPNADQVLDGRRGVAVSAPAALTFQLANTHEQVIATFEVAITGDLASYLSSSTNGDSINPGNLTYVTITPGPNIAELAAGASYTGVVTFTDVSGTPEVIEEITITLSQQGGYRRRHWRGFK